MYIYRKRKFVFLGQQTMNGNRRLLFQQTCSSMVASRVEQLTQDDRVLFLYAYNLVGRITLLQEFYR
jgi:hypothetical protein